MKILLLGEKSELLVNSIRNSFIDVFIERYDLPLTLNYFSIHGKPDFIISFGYRHIVSQEILCLFEKNIINLHISYLPYNRGSDPNLWSFLEDTPKGVTIHHMVAKLDAGDIILQKEIFFNYNETLKSSYDILINEIVKLFSDNCADIINCCIKPTPQIYIGGGYHSLKDKLPFEYLISEKGFDTQVSTLIGKARRQL